MGLIERALQRVQLEIHRFPLEEISLGGRCATFLFRWELFRCRWFAIYLHKFVADDGCLDYHDHPKRFVSIGLSGEYLEHVLHPDGLETSEAYVAPWIRTFNGTHAHRITGPTAERPCWTLAFVGRASRDWGFWHQGEWILWTRYLRSPAADRRKHCA